MNNPDITPLITAYQIAKAARRNRQTGKKYTDRDFALNYLSSDHSMVTKVLNNKAVSQPVVDAIRQFVRDSELLIATAMRDVQSVVKDES